MADDLGEALAQLRPMLLHPEHLVRAVAAGRRRAAAPAHVRAELRPVALRSGIRLQLVTTDGLLPTTRNLAPGPDAEAAVDALLAEPFGNWHVETADRTVQLRVTKKGAAQVHVTPGTPAAASRPAPAAAAPHDRPARHLLDPGDALFTALGADADKRRQVDAFLRQLAAVLPRAARSAAEQDRPLRVVDLGCGNAYLTFAAHRWLAGHADLPRGVLTVGVDSRPDLVERNERLARSLKAGSGLGFSVGTIEAAEPDLPGPPDVVLALHACDTATDDALARAVRWGARAVLAAPCCHHDVQRQLGAATGAGAAPPHPYAALTRHAILRERFADVLTDALRADVLRLLGHRVDVVEFVDSRHTPRNALLRVERTGVTPDADRRREYTDLAAAWHVRPALADRLAPELDAVLRVTGAP